jgi:RNA polymerase sigma-70 factor (ECF subfamily)
VDERDLLVAILNGDSAAFDRLVETYQVPVYNLAYRMVGRPEDAEDIAQEAFVRAYTKLHTFDLEKKFSSWLLAITSHLCIDHLRRKKAVFLEDQDYAEWMGNSQEAPELLALQEEQKEELRKLLSSLPPKYRHILALRYFNELSYAEIEEITGLAEGTVKTRLHRARKMLADLVSSPLTWSPRWSPKPTQLTTV